MDLPRPRNATQPPCQRSGARASPNCPIRNGLSGRRRRRASGAGISARPASSLVSPLGRGDAGRCAAIPTAARPVARRCALSPTRLRKFPPAPRRHAGSSTFLTHTPGLPMAPSLRTRQMNPRKVSPYDSAIRPRRSSVVSQPGREPIRPTIADRPNDTADGSGAQSSRIPSRSRPFIRSSARSPRHSIRMTIHCAPEPGGHPALAGAGRLRAAAWRRAPGPWQRSSDSGD